VLEALHAALNLRITRSEGKAMTEPILEVENITKIYPGVRALDNVSLSIEKGCVHCIVGENGAGKSTFIKILTGAVRKDAGTIRLGSAIYNPRHIRDSLQAGIGVLFQELNVVDGLSVEQNLTLGVEKSFFGVVRESLSSREILKTLSSLDPKIAPHASVSNLSFAKKQVIEIAKAIASNARIIIMDEPTAALSEEEVGKLFAIIHELKKKGVTILYISHRLDEIFQIGDYVTVFRDGKIVNSCLVSEVKSKKELIRMMIGSFTEHTYVPREIDRSAKVLEVSGVRTSKISNVSFDLCRGEILGFYGLVGSGKTEVARAIFGADPILQGTILVEGVPVRITRPKDALRAGISMIPEERRIEGLLSRLSIRENITIMNPKKISRFSIVSQPREREIARSFVKKLRINADSIEKNVALLSGGNQQKVVVSKSLNADAKVLLLDEPTRGVDVGAKEEIHSIIRGLARDGMSAIVFSSELPEICNLCDRIVLMHERRILSTVENGPALDSEKIFHLISGGE
jgi:ribose transport system ATP-binding protein